MPFVSSPTTYPSTSPAHDESSPRKRRKLDSWEREPLKHISANTQQDAVAGFLLTDSDDDGEDMALFKARGVRTSQHTHPSSDPKDVESVMCGAIADDNRLKPTEHSEALLPESVKSLESSGSVQDLAKKSSCDDHTEPTELGILNSQTWIKTCSGRVMRTRRKPERESLSYEQIIAGRSNASAGHKGQKSFYGVPVHQLMEEATREITSSGVAEERERNLPSIALDQSGAPEIDHYSAQRTTMWTEKYRARKFTDLVGDERTHRSVLKWLKTWDSIVFPSASRSRQKANPMAEEQGSELSHRKILLLTGPPGLGKTTLAHVCAKQAGYEVQEINASDERSRDVVKGKIKDMVGTENVKQVGVPLSNKSKKAARPLCIVVDEVDGAVGGSNGSGDGGFIKALVDLVALDQKNSTSGSRPHDNYVRRKKKGDSFRLLRPLILICNDVYHPSLRLLRQGSTAETIFVRKPPLNMVVPRLQHIFEREGFLCDGDGVRQLCEATWGVSSRREDKAAGGTCEGDMRGILVIGEWVASKLRAECSTSGEAIRLTKRWVEQNILGDLSNGGGSARSLGRGGAKELVDRIFAHNAGFPSMSPTAGCHPKEGIPENAKARVMDRLRELIASTGEDDRAMADCFAIYPSLPYQDDNFLTKPGLAYDWLQFHDQISSLVHHSQQWELAPYLPTPLLAFHDLFASNSRHTYSNAMSSTTTSENSGKDAESTLFEGLRASYVASETTKANRAILQHLQSQLSLPLSRAFRSLEDLSGELLPYVLRMLSPEVKPVVVGGSEKGVASVRRGAEKDMVHRGVDAMIACGVKFEKSRVDNGDRARTGDAGGWIYRMEPGIDALGVFETAAKEHETSKTRFAVRQVLEQEWTREVAKREQEARVRRMKTATRANDDVSNGATHESNALGQVGNVKMTAKRNGITLDFFGRPVACPETTIDGIDHASEAKGKKARLHAEQDTSDERKVWVTYHEGFSNAVRKGITLKELLESF